MGGGRQSIFPVAHVCISRGLGASEIFKSEEMGLKANETGEKKDVSLRSTKDLRRLPVRPVKCFKIL